MLGKHLLATRTRAEKAKEGTAAATHRSIDRPLPIQFRLYFCQQRMAYKDALLKIVHHSVRPLPHRQLSRLEQRENRTMRPHSGICFASRNMHLRLDKHQVPPRKIQRYGRKHISYSLGIQRLRIDKKRAVRTQSAYKTLHLLFRKRKTVHLGDCPHRTSSITAAATQAGTTRDDLLQVDAKRRKLTTLLP